MNQNRSRLSESRIVDLFLLFCNLTLIIFCPCFVYGQVEVNDFEIDQNEYKEYYKNAVANDRKEEQARLLEIIVKDYNSKNNWDSVYIYNNKLAQVQLALGNKERFLNAYMVNLSIDEISKKSILNHKAKIELISEYLDDPDINDFRKGQIAEVVAKYVFYNEDRDSSIIIMDKAIAYSEMPTVEKAYALGQRTQKAAFLNGMGRNEEAINELIYVANNDQFAFEPALKRWYVFDQLGELFLDIDDFPKAEEYFIKAIRIAEDKNYSSSMADSKRVLGGAKIKEGKVEEGYLLLNQSIKIFRKKKNFRNLVSVFSTFGESYLINGNLELAKSNIDSANLYLVKVNQSTISTNKKAIIGNLNLLKARYHVETKDYEKATTILLTMSDKKLLKDYPKFRMQTSYLNYRIEKDRGAESKALEFYEDYIHQRDSIAQRNSAMRVQVIEAQFNRQEQDKTIAVLDAVTQEQKKSLSLRNTALIVGGVMLAFLAGLLIGLYRLFRKNKEYQLKLEAQNITIHNALAENKVLIKEIHHRVKNNLQVISSLLSLQERKVTDENTKEALKSSKTRVETMSILHQSLYQGDEIRGIGVKDYFTDLVNNLIDTYSVNRNIKTSIDIDDLKIDVDSLIPLGLMANELICNAIKHGIGDDDQGEIRISLKDFDNAIVLCIEDSGGRLPSNQLTIKEGSLGVKLIRAFSNRLDGTIQVDVGEFTKISLLVKKDNINFINE